MSSTRYAADDAPLSQERYASSSAYEPGLLCNLVAKRCKAILRPEDRALIYWIQQRSHDEGGLTKFAADFLAAFPERIGTGAMRRIGKRAGQRYTQAEADEVARSFKRRRRILPTESFSVGGDYNRDDEVGASASLEVSHYIERCYHKSSEGRRDLPEHLKAICLNPKMSLEDRNNVANGYTASYSQVSCPSLWWFNDLIGALHLYRLRQIEAAVSGIAETSISKQVFEDLDYAAHCHGLVIIEGDQRTGKSTSAKNWVEQHPGQAIYVKLGVGNDDATFFRSIARALGTAASLTRKPTEMQMKIEDALQEGHLLLVLDEAHFCWAQTQRPRSAPARMDWIRTALNDFNVGVVLISTPQFDRSCELYEKQLKWNAKQIKGRVKLHRLLPVELPEEDLTAVARKMAPQADESSILRLVGFAQSSDDYLAGIERLMCRATFFASRDGREVAGRSDIKRALDEATPRLETVEPSPAPKPKKQRGGIRATPRGGSRTTLSDSLPPALARRASMDSPASEDAGFEASNRLQFTGAAASD